MLACSHRLGKFGIGRHLKKVVLSGCANITDATLVRLAMAQHQSLQVPSCLSRLATWLNTLEQSVVKILLDVFRLVCSLSVFCCTDCNLNSTSAKRMIL